MFTSTLVASLSLWYVKGEDSEALTGLDEMNCWWAKRRERHVLL